MDYGGLRWIMADMSDEEGAQGYLYEPQRSDYPDLCLNSRDFSDSSDSENDNFSINWRHGRAKMASSDWCKCGKCVVQKTDDECYCCKEHELLIEQSYTLKCATDIDNLEEYVAHKPSLEMAYIHGMIKRCLKGPAPQELSNR